MNRILITAAATLATGIAVTGLVFAGEAAASRPSTSSPTAGPVVEGEYRNAAWGLIINIKNDSTHTLTLLDVGGATPKNSPKAVLRPGETDRLAYSADSTGMTVRLTYRVDETAETVFPAFGVPLVGPNNFACSANDRSRNSPVGSKCDIGSGWEPDAHLTFVDR